MSFKNNYKLMKNIIYFILIVVTFACQNLETKSNSQQK